MKVENLYDFSFFYKKLLTSVYNYAYNDSASGDGMEVQNPRYQNQGVHVVSAIFTVDKGITKVLLIKRKYDPYSGMWALVSGALYNDEELLDCMKREIKEKTGIENIHLELFDVFSALDRSPAMRMVAIAYVGIINKNKYELLKETLRTIDAEWVDMKSIPNLAFDHNIILMSAIEVLRKRIKETDLLKNLYSDGFTMPEIQKVYESILGKTYDRRNFRKKLLSTGMIEETSRVEKFDGNKPAKIYVFKENMEDRNVF